MADKYVAYVGSYTRGESKGLSIFDFEPETLTFKLREVFEISNPSVVHISYDQKYLYCNCDEGVASFKILMDFVRAIWQRTGRTVILSLRDTMMGS